VQQLAASLDAEQVKAAHRGLGMPFQFDSVASEVRAAAARSRQQPPGQPSLLACCSWPLLD
jgi:hypothetical protein